MMGTRSLLGSNVLHCPGLDRQSCCQSHICYPHVGKGEWLRNIPALRLMPRITCFEVVYPVKPAVATKEDSEAIMVIESQERPRSGALRSTGRRVCFIITAEASLVT
jgi:hypothetical protein